MVAAAAAARAAASAVRASLLIVHLLATRRVTHQMGAYHVLRVALAYLAETDLGARPIVLPPADADADADIGGDDDVAAERGDAARRRQRARRELSEQFPFVLCDSSGRLNFGAAVTAGALAELRASASHALALLDSSELDDPQIFSHLFTKAQPAAYRYDAIAALPSPPSPPPPLAPAVREAIAEPLPPPAATDADGDGAAAAAAAAKAARCRPPVWLCDGAAAPSVEALLARGLRTRARLVRCWQPPPPPWKCSSPPPPPPIHVGLVLDARRAHALVDRGPAATDAEGGGGGGRCGAPSLRRVGSRTARSWRRWCGRAPAPHATRC